ncbi:MAG: hypothetical protein HOO67_01830, partial [Candidatus Peribacteraceae bacterium]|nr:hypothetical protein [Candidatus Peribacteraceae bacterium]
MSENDKAPNTGHYASKVERYLERMESKPPIDPAHQALLNRLKEIRRAALPAVNVHTVLINDPEYAPVLAQRHKRLMVKDFVLEFGENGTVDDLHTLQKSIEANGGFFQLYSNTFVRDRIENSVQDPNKQGWIIAESLGQARKEDLSLGPEIAGGDIQLWIPSIRIRILIKELMRDKNKGDSFDRNGRDGWKEVAER